MAHHTGRAAAPGGGQRKGPVEGVRQAHARRGDRLHLPGGVVPEADRTRVEGDGAQPPPAVIVEDEGVAARAIHAGQLLILVVGVDRRPRAGDGRRDVPLCQIHRRVGEQVPGTARRDDLDHVAVRVVGEAEHPAVGQRLRVDPIGVVIAERHTVLHRVGEGDRPVARVVGNRRLPGPLRDGLGFAAFRHSLAAGGYPKAPRQPEVLSSQNLHGQGSDFELQGGLKALPVRFTNLLVNQGPSIVASV